MMRILLLVSLMAMIAPGAALAEWVTITCTFETECYEAEACDGAGFSMDLSAGEAPGEVVMRSAAETISGTGAGHDATSLIWRAETESAAHLLSWGADGAARYSVHLLMGPAMVSYIGSCEAKN
ncbi:MAG: hypothetical protein OIF40_15235 [Mangrovicoccus sp.]|nr:hypothetical protein [Mangrovicoccus sp.]